MQSALYQQDEKNWTKCRLTGAASGLPSENMAIWQAWISRAPHVPPHQFRHACGFAQTDQGADTRLIQDYLGYRNIQHTLQYTATNPPRLEWLWRR
jgi:site-specific recombinase XerD